MEQKCDLVVLETGIGGLLDATNVIKKPLVCAITSVSFDHMALLGNTLTEIAAQKAGIIKSAALWCSPRTIPWTWCVWYRTLPSGKMPSW